jgi:hypothetical protein
MTDEDADIRLNLKNVSVRLKKRVYTSIRITHAIP